jgi:hypothetical protein
MLILVLKFECFQCVVVALCYRYSVLHTFKHIQYVPLMPRGLATRPRFLSLHLCFLYLLHMLLESAYIGYNKTMLLISFVHVFFPIENLLSTQKHASYSSCLCCKKEGCMVWHPWNLYFCNGHIQVDVMNLFRVQLCIYIDVDCILYHDSDM